MKESTTALLERPTTLGVMPLKNTKGTTILPQIECVGEILPAYTKKAIDFLHQQDNLSYTTCPCCGSPLSFRIDMRSDVAHLEKRETFMVTCAKCYLGTPLITFGLSEEFLPLAAAHVFLVLQHEQDNNDSLFVKDLKKDFGAHSFQSVVAEVFAQLPHVSEHDKIIGARAFFLDNGFSPDDSDTLSHKYFNESFAHL